MIQLRILPLLFFFSLTAFVAKAGAPANGNTPFNSVSPGPKASGSGGGSGITAANVEGFNFKLTTANAGPTMVIEVWDGIVGTGNGVAFYEQSSSINPLFTGITVTANNGAKFDLNSIGINGQSSGGGSSNVTITGLNAAGNPVSGATFSGIADVSTLTTFNLSGNAAFKGIFGIRITSADLVYAFVDNINLSNVLLPLPLTWLDFSAAKQDAAVVLKWRTALEERTKDFAVQRSANETGWQTIGTVSAAGNSVAERSYTYADASPLGGANYYRIVQRDADGKMNYSKVVCVTLAAKTNHLAVYPNPVLNHQLYVMMEKAATVQVVNSAGNVVLRKELAAGLQKLSFERLPAGIYHIIAGAEKSTFLVP
jgi:hypothetical protein